MKKDTAYNDSKARADVTAWQAGDKAAGNRLIHGITPLIRSCAVKIFSQSTIAKYGADLMQAGLAGIAKEMNRPELLTQTEKQGTKVISWLRNAGSNRMIDEAGRIGVLNRRQINDFKAIERADHALGTEGLSLTEAKLQFIQEEAKRSGREAPSKARLRHVEEQHEHSDIDDVPETAFACEKSDSLARTIFDAQKILGRATSEFSRVTGRPLAQCEVIATAFLANRLDATRIEELMTTHLQPAGVTTGNTTDSGGRILQHFERVVRSIADASQQRPPEPQSTLDDIILPTAKTTLAGLGYK
jgi:hypothetical protein